MKEHEVKMVRINTLTFEYKLFIMKLEENTCDIQKLFIHIVNHMRTLGKLFQNNDLLKKSS